jgi:hypothetical protein
MKKILLLVCTLLVFCGVSFAQPVADGQEYNEQMQENNNEFSDTNQAENNSNFSNAAGDTCDPEKDIMLNINIPFVGRCIKKSASADSVDDGTENSTVGNVFPKLMGGMMRLVMTAIYIIWFLGILVGGFMIAASGASPGLREKGKNMIIMIVGWLILLGASWVILNLINPNFFWTSS